MLSQLFNMVLVSTSQSLASEQALKGREQPRTMTSKSSIPNAKAKEVDSDEDTTETTTESGSSLSSSSSRRNSVRFGSVLIHFHPIVLSNNPAVKEGPPIELAWTASHSELFQIDDLMVDSKKSTAGNVKRIVREEREKWLKESGFCEECLEKASAEIGEIQKSRVEEVTLLKERVKNQKAAHDHEKVALDLYRLMSKASLRAFNRGSRRLSQKSSNVGMVDKAETMRQKQMMARQAKPFFRRLFRRGKSVV